MKKQKSNKSKMGFSLLELSVVMLVIGTLAVGITEGEFIMSRAKVTIAKTLTRNSPVALIPDLVAWYETSLDTSFNSNVYDGEALADANGGAWFNNSPYSKANNNATVVSAPRYYESVINYLPTVRFTSGNTLAFNTRALNQKYYTVFVVEQRRATTGTLVDLGGNVLAYSNSALLGDSIVGSSAVGAFVIGTFIPRVDTFVSDTTSRRTYINGTVGATAGSEGLITASDFGIIGAGFTGDIAEIIIFNRGLKLSERNYIQKYLGKKYDIEVVVSVN